MRLAVIALLGVAAIAVGLVAPQSPVEAVGAADVIGVYDLRLRGQAFRRDAETSAVDEATVRGLARMTVTSAADDPRLVSIEIALGKGLTGGLLDVTTPTPALRGTGVLVGDSLTVIGAGQANFVNAVTLRFAKRGRKVAGSWVSSFPGSDTRAGFVGGAGVELKGKRRKAPSVASASSLR